MWKRLHLGLQSSWQWWQRGRNERRAARKRARFWSELRAGEREAEARTRP